MKKQSRSAGFGVVEIIVVLVVVGLVGFVGYYIFTQQNKPAQNQNTQAQNEVSSNGQSTQTSTNEGYVEVTDWGVKIALRDYNKVQMTASNQGGLFSGGSEHYDGVAEPSFKPEFLQDKNCEPGLNLYRSKEAFTDGQGQKKIGDYYYTITGGPGNCSDNPESSDDQLKSRFLKDFTLENLMSR